MPTRLLYPVALAQGLWVRWRTPRLPPAHGDHGTCGHGTEEIRLVGIGDSIVAGVGVDDQRNALVGQFARLLHRRTGRTVHWAVHAYNGETSAGILAEVAGKIPRADLYVLSAGVNDVTHLVGATRYADNLARLVALIRRGAPQADVLFVGIPPLDRFPALPWPLGRLLGNRARLLQAAAREALAHEHAVCFDFPARLPDGGFAPDGFHPGADACAEWASWLLDLLFAHRASGWSRRFGLRSDT